MLVDMPEPLAVEATGRPVLALMTSFSTSFPAAAQLFTSVSVGCPAVMVLVTLAFGIVAMMRSTPARTCGFSGAAIIASMAFDQMWLSVICFCCSRVGGFGGTYFLPSALATALSFSVLARSGSGFVPGAMLETAIRARAVLMSPFTA